MAGLTRNELVAALRRPGGGSVILEDGRRIVREDDLPPEEELARGDPVREAAARRDLRRDILRLQERLGGLEEGSRALQAPTAPEVSREDLEEALKALDESLARQAYLEDQIRGLQESKLAKEPSPGSSQ